MTYELTDSPHTEVSFCYTKISSCCLDTLRKQYPVSFCGPAVFGLLLYQLLFSVNLMMVVMVMVLAVLSNSQKLVHRMTYHISSLGALGFKTMCAGGTDCLTDNANTAYVVSLPSPLLIMRVLAQRGSSWDTRDLFFLFKKYARYLATGKLFEIIKN